MHPPSLSGDPPRRSQIWRWVTRTATLALAGWIASCIDGKEQYWIAGDGGGRAEIEYSVPSSIARMEGGNERIRKTLEDYFKETPAIRDGTCEVTTTDGRTRVSVCFGFDSGFKLAETSAHLGNGQLPSAVKHLVGKVQAEIHGRTLEVTRSARPDKAIPAAALLPQNQLSGNKLVCIVHLPAPAKETNATRVTDDRRTLTWETALAETIDHPFIMHFTMDLPLPWGKILLGIATLLAMVMVCARWKMKSRNITHPTSPPTKN